LVLLTAMSLQAGLTKEFFTASRLAWISIGEF
jgi:hypothetical protein